MNEATSISIAIADNHPVVHQGLNAYFSQHQQIKIVDNISNFLQVEPLLSVKNIEVLVFDLELDALKSINEIKLLTKQFPETRFIAFTNLSEEIYTPNAIKAGVSAFLNKSRSLDDLASAILLARGGQHRFNEKLLQKLSLIAKQNKSERIYRKLSTREVEVLRYLSQGKKNNEISKLLSLNEKTISTYKLRLLNKLDVTNLVDLVDKAKKLEIF